MHAVQEDFPGIDIGFYPNFPEVHLSLTARGPERQPLEETLQRFMAALSRELGDVMLGTDGAPLEEVVGRRLRDQKKNLAVAESCTGGLICHRLTNISGSSDYFMGGVVTYSNQAKMDLLRVSADTLAEKGAVSSETVAAMALGVKELFHTNFGLGSDGHCRPHRGHPGEARGPGVHGTGYLKGSGIPPPPLSRGPGDDQDPHGPNCLGLAAPGVETMNKAEWVRFLIPFPFDREHRHLACEPQAGSLCSR